LASLIEMQDLQASNKLCKKQAQWMKQQLNI